MSIDYVESMVPFEIRIEGIENDSTAKRRVQDIILNAGGMNRGGICRYRVVQAKTKGKPNGFVTIFVVLGRAYYQNWLMVPQKSHNVRCYPEEKFHFVLHPNPLPLETTTNISRERPVF